MEVIRTFGYTNTLSKLSNIQNTSVIKTPSLYKNENTSKVMRHFSSLDIATSFPLKKVKLDHYQKNGNTTHFQKNAKMEHYQRNGLNNNLPKRITRCNLPKKAISTLKEWLLCNWHDPYPTEKEKISLANATGLKLLQINNWLINARRRLLPGICRKYGLDLSKCKIAKRGGNKTMVLEKLQSRTEEIVPYTLSDSPDLDRFSLSFPSSDVASCPTSDTYNIVLKVPDSPEHPVMLDYLADVMLVNEELEKQPNEEGLSRQELLCRRGLGERLYPCSP